MAKKTSTPEIQKEEDQLDDSSPADAKRQQLLEEVFRVMAQDGYDGCTVVVKNGIERRRFQMTVDIKEVEWIA